MKALAVTRGYFDAWNHRNADGIIAAFTEGGTYSDPTVGQAMSREAAADYARVLWDAFPDLTFDIISKAETGPETVAAQWLMRGTNTGSLRGRPPTGAFSITVLQGRSDGEAQQISQLSREIAKEMLEMQEFISWMGMRVGHHMMTVTAWETP